MKNYFSSTFIAVCLPLFTVLIIFSLFARLLAFEDAGFPLLNHLVHSIFLWSPLYISTCFIYYKGKDIELANFLCYIVFVVSTGYPSYTSFFSFGIVGAILVSYIVVYIYENINISIKANSMTFLSESIIKLFISILITLSISIVFSTLLPFILDLLINLMYFLSVEYEPIFFFFNHLLITSLLPLALQDIFYTVDWSLNTGLLTDDLSLNYLHTLISQNQEQNSAFFTTNVFAIIATFTVIYFSLFSPKEKRLFAVFLVFATIFTLISGNSLALLLILFLYSPILFFSFAVLNTTIFSLLEIFDLNDRIFSNGSLLFLLDSPDIKEQILLYLEIQAGIFVSFLIILLFSIKIFSLARNKNSDKNNLILIDALGGISNITKATVDGKKVKFILLNKSLVSIEAIEILSNVIAVIDPGSNNIQILFEEEIPKKIIAQIEENLQLKTVTQVINNKTLNDT